MNLGLKDKIAIVCASSKGLGKAVAFALAEEGAKVTICARGKDALYETAEEIRSKTGASVLALAADVSQEESAAEIVAETVAKFGSVHILVNNAGGPPFGDFLSFSNDDWRRALELNLLSAINFTKHCLPHMQRQKWGRIVNITSIAVKQPISGLILSNTARAAVIGFAKTVSNEFGGFNILVNNVCPGRILTDRILHLADERAKREGKTREEVLRGMEADIPVGRIGSPEEFASLVVFLASERASYITGATVQIDGGLVRGAF